MHGPLSDAAPLPDTYQGAAPPLRLPALAGSQRADVAIIGGGITGLSAALHLREAGCSVAVLEGREIGWGGSGRAFGQVVPYAKHNESHVLKAFGPDWGPRLLAGLAAGPELVFGLIARHGMGCELARTGLIFAAHADRAERGLEARAAYWQAHGADVAILRGAELEAQTGTRFYRAGLLDRRGGCINPLAYARGLARAVLSAGGAVHEDSPALSVQQVRGAWQVRTPAGALQADHVVLATDAYTGDLWPGLRRAIVPLRAYQLISRPLPNALRRTVLPGGQALTDTRRLYSGIRLRSDGRLHISVDGPVFSTAGLPDAAAGTRRVGALFPHLPVPEWEHSVMGWVGMSADQYPHLYRLAPGLTAAQGLSGRGIAFGTLLGQEASRRVLDRPHHEWMLPDTKLRPVRGGVLTRGLVRGLLGSYRILDAIDLRRRG